MEAVAALMGVGAASNGAGGIGVSAGLHHHVATVCDGIQTFWCSEGALGGDHHLVAKGDGAQTVGVVVPADGHAVFAPMGHDGATSDGDVARCGTLTSTYTGSLVVAPSLYVTAGDGDGAAVDIVGCPPFLAAADTSCVVAAMGLHMSTTDGDGAAIAITATANTSTAL